MDYSEALVALSGALRFGINPSLDGITALCQAMGRPHDSFVSVQVTGTNGKTSTARFLEAVLRAEGVRTGLYTSPELERYPERIEVAGRVVSDAEFAEAVSAALVAAGAVDADGPSAEGGGPTEFELLTAAALWLFRDTGVEVAVLEVGMGGRWDATSVVSPVVSVVTGVGLDHMAILGPTVEAIAAEKAAIIRSGSIAVLGAGTRATRSVFVEAAAVAGVPVVVPEFEVTRHPSSPDGLTVADVVTPYARYARLAMAVPAYQTANVAPALAAAEAVLGRELDPARLRGALARVKVPGRFELVRREPPVIVDGSHNPQAAKTLAGAIEDAWPDPTQRPLVVLGVLGDKDARGIVEELSRAGCDFAVTRPDSPRALDVLELAGVVWAVTGEEPRVFDNVSAALESLVPGSPHGLVITGSLRTAGEARAALRGVGDVDCGSQESAREGRR